MDTDLQSFLSWHRRHTIEEDTKYFERAKALGFAKSYRPQDSSYTPWGSMESLFAEMVRTFRNSPMQATGSVQLLRIERNPPRAHLRLTKAGSVGEIVVPFYPEMCYRHEDNMNWLRHCTAEGLKGLKLKLVQRG